ncbi:placenta-expressed transcript 1 protein-like [Gopherus evgoodei]|uniref:placenta-expressed transcript 1 protein-like n=1 Tax=Gopherus evgoodei TaxID=1825980 RepID=UPI0011CFEC08|nr:placenta-expressed transcript 1 protein-like [Gopherus evgoodei]
MSLAEAERLAKPIMAALISTLQLLFLGALISPVYLEDACHPIQNATASGSYSLSVNPANYMANTSYNVTISGLVDGSSLLLQALNSQNSSVGRWEGQVLNCSDGLSAAQENITNKATATVQWSSPDNESAPVEIRVFVTLSNSSTLLQKTTLNTASTASPGSTTETPTTSSKITSSSTTNSVSTVQASSFFLAAVHLLSVFVTCKLFS